MSAFWLSVLGSILVALFVEYTPVMAAALVRLSAHLLPISERERYRNEWLADLAAQAGQFEKLRWALGTFQGAMQVSASLRAEEKRLVLRGQKVDQVVQGLSLALTAREARLGFTTTRLLELSDGFAQHLQLSPDDRQVLRWGVYLHDIGKLEMDLALLAKRGPLTADEFRAVIKHPDYGADTARRIEGLPQATIDIILHHHERFDGQGYPLGLANESIPFLVRLFIILDIYDALTSERSYKRAWSSDDALIFLEREAGRTFDPALTKAFSAYIRNSTTHR